MELVPLLASECRWALDSIPDELQILIFQNLPTFDQVQLSLTSKHFYTIFQNNRKQLLENILLQNVPLSAKNIEILKTLTQKTRKDFVVKGFVIRSGNCN